MAETERLKALGETEPRLARDPVSQPIINTWLDAIGETDPRFTQGRRRRRWRRSGRCTGCDPTRPRATRCRGAMEMLDEAGFTSVLGTNCDQTYERYLRVGEQVSVTTRLEYVVGPKQTGVGEGYFVTTGNGWWVGDRGGRDDVVPGAQVQAAAIRRGRGRSGPVADHPAGAQPGHRLLLGGHRRRASCGSRSATPAACCATRPARCARRATRWTAGTSSRPAAARSSPSWCTTRRRCPAASCR